VEWRFRPMSEGEINVDPIEGMGRLRSAPESLSQHGWEPHIRIFPGDQAYQLWVSVSKAILGRLVALSRQSHGLSR
jgi:hypothetical protein